MPDGFVDFQGNDSVSGSFTLSFDDLAGSIIGNSALTGDLTVENVIIEISVIEGNSSLTGDLTIDSGSVVTPSEGSTELVGNENLTGNLTVIDAPIEVPPEPLAPCNVTYDIETCACVT